MKTINDSPLSSRAHHPKNRTFPSFPPNSTAWAVLYHASMEICDQYDLPGGEERYLV
jgi:hypothetical protein